MRRLMLTVVEGLLVATLDIIIELTIVEIGAGLWCWKHQYSHSLDKPGVGSVQ